MAQGLEWPAFVVVGDDGLHRRIEWQIACSVVRGDIAAGQALPTEAELIERFGVSRSVVRAALRSLAQRGLVVMRQGRRSTVLPAQSWNILDPLVLAAHRANGALRPLISDALQVRCWLEPEAAAVAALNADDALRADLADCIERMESALDDTPRFVAADLAFHERIAVASDNRVLVRIMTSMQDVVLAGREMTSQTRQTLTTGLADHRVIYGAIARADPEGARREMAHHVGRTLQHLPERIGDEL